MKRALVFLLVLPSCGEQVPAEVVGVAECEAFAKNLLRSPSTYKRIKVETEDKARVTPARFFQLTRQHPTTEPPKYLGYRWVQITYDAANAYGTPIREKYQCAFELSAGDIAKIDSIRKAAEDPTSRLATKKASQAVLDFEQAAKNAGVPGEVKAPEFPTYDCCVGDNWDFAQAVMNGS